MRRQHLRKVTILHPDCQIDEAWPLTVYPMNRKKWKQVKMRAKRYTQQAAKEDGR